VSMGLSLGIVGQGSQRLEVGLESRELLIFRDVSAVPLSAKIATVAAANTIVIARSNAPEIFSPTVIFVIVGKDLRIIPRRRRHLHLIDIDFSAVA